MVGLHGELRFSGGNVGLVIQNNINLIESWQVFVLKAAQMFPYLVILRFHFNLLGSVEFIILLV